MSSLLLLGMLVDPWTYALVALVALLFFGRRLPEVGRSLGKGIAEFKKGLHDVGDELNKEEPPPPPPQRPTLSPPQYDYTAPSRTLPAEQRPPVEAGVPTTPGVPGQVPQPGEPPRPEQGPPN